MWYRRHGFLWLGLVLLLTAAGPVPEEEVLDEVPDPMEATSDLTEEAYYSRFGRQQRPADFAGREQSPICPDTEVRAQVLAPARSSLPVGLLVLCDDERGEREMDALRLERGMRMLVVRVFCADRSRLTKHDFVAAALNIASPLIEAGRVDPERVYIAGFGHSATMACEVALWFGDRFSGGYFYDQAMFYGTQGGYRSFYPHPPGRYRDAILEHTYVLGFDTPIEQIRVLEGAELRVGAANTQRVMLDWFQARGMRHLPTGVYFPDVDTAMTGEALSEVVRYLDRPLGDKLATALERYERADRRSRFGDEVSALAEARQFCFDPDQYAELTALQRRLLEGYDADIRAAYDLLDAEAWDALSDKIVEIRRTYRVYGEGDVAELRALARERSRAGG